MFKKNSLPKRLFVCLLIIIIAFSETGASKSNSYEDLSKALKKYPSDSIPLPDLLEIMNNYISSLSSGKKSSKKMKNTPEELLSQAYTDTTAVTLGSRKVCPAELNLYFAEEYFDYIEDPSNADYLDELLAIDSFSDLATMKHGRKRETWREFFLDRAVKTLQRSLALAKFAVENKLPFSEDKLLSPAAIQEAENRFLRSSPSCFGVPSSYINSYVEINGLASLSLDYLQKEYNKQQHPDSFNSFVTSKILQYYYLSTTTYTPFAKIVGLSSSDF